MDANLGELVKAARAFGMTVHVTNADWDLTVQYAGKTELWECKNGKGRVTEVQQKLKDQGWTIRTVRNVQDVLNARKAMMQ